MLRRNRLNLLQKGPFRLRLRDRTDSGHARNRSANGRPGRMRGMEKADGRLGRSL